MPTVVASHLFKAYKNPPTKSRRRVRVVTPMGIGAVTRTKALASYVRIDYL